MHKLFLGLLLSGGAFGQSAGDALEAVTRVPEKVTQLRCRVFAVDVERGGAIETSDRTTEVGQWLGRQEDQNWRLHSMDFEMGMKKTGFPQGWVQVCARPD